MTMLKIIPCDRTDLEKEVIRTLMSPTATPRELDEAVERLSPAGKLRMISSQKPDQPQSET
jgi:hypothetical protein